MKIAIIADPLDNQSAGVHVFTRELIAALIRIGKADDLVLLRERHDPELKIKQIVNLKKKNNMKIMMPRCLPQSLANVTNH